MFLLCLGSKVCKTVNLGGIFTFFWKAYCTNSKHTKHLQIAEQVALGVSQLVSNDILEQVYSEKPALHCQKRIFEIGEGNILITHRKHYGQEKVRKTSVLNGQCLENFYW